MNSAQGAPPQQVECKDPGGGAGLRRMALAVEQSPVSIVITDSQGTIEYVNPKFTELTGYSSAEAVGQNPRIMKGGKTPDVVYRSLWETILSGRVWHGEFLNRRKGGGLFWESASISPIKGPDGAITHFLAVKEDISQRKEMEQALQRARDVAERADRLKSAFLANVSHEIRTPMNGIFGMADLLRETPLTPEQQEYLQALRQSADSLWSVLNGLLDFSRMQERKVELRQVSFHLRDNLEGVLKTIAPRAAGKGLELRCRVAPEVPDLLVGDPGRLLQVLANLLDNGVKFTESGSVELGVTAGEAGEERAKLHFAVQDTGIGISPELQQQVFAPFSQADPSSTRRYGGTGLGLTIAARLVELMGGGLQVASEPGCGSTFAFTLGFALPRDTDRAGGGHEPLHPRGGGGEEAASEVFDCREALARMAGDRELFREVAGIFVADSVQMMAAVREAAAAGDGPRLNRAAHTLKGAISNFGAPVPMGLALGLERQGKNGELAGSQERCAELERELERLRGALSTYAGNSDEDTDSGG